MSRTETEANYAARVARVIDYIQQKLDCELTVDELSRVAGFSKFHFHRQFSAYVGTTVSRVIVLMRLKQASYQLAFDQERRVIDIALDAGFSGPEAFARAFKREQGQTPSDFRKAPKWEAWLQACEFPRIERSSVLDVRVEMVDEERIAVLEHRGSPRKIMESVSRFIEWRKQSGLSPNATSKTFGIPHSDPEQTPPDEFRFDICGSIDSEIPDNAQGVIEKLIPGGRCAIVRHVGSTDETGSVVRSMYADWLPSSGEELREHPVYFHYVKRMPTVSEHEQVTDIYLPLREK